MAEDLVKLKRIRDQQNNHLKRANQFINNLNLDQITLSTYNSIKARLDNLRSVYGIFEEAQLKIEGLEDNPDSSEEERATFENNYFELIGKFEEVLQKLRAPSPSLDDPEDNDELGDTENVQNPSNIPTSAPESFRPEPNVNKIQANEVPPGTNEVPAGENTNVVPSGTNVVPSGTNVVPSGTNVVPSGTNVVPSGTNVVPSGTCVGPSGPNMIPSGSSVFNPGTMMVPSNGNVGTLSSNNNGFIGQSTIPYSLENNRLVAMPSTQSQQMIPANLINSQFLSTPFSTFSGGNNSNSSNDLQGQVIQGGQPSNSSGTIGQMPYYYSQPPLNLPFETNSLKFNGDYNRWVEFRDSFLAYVDRNAALSEMHKLHYLRACLDPEPFEIIRSIPVAAQNYKMAWQALIDRYEKSHLIINHHVKEILQAPKITRESAKDIRNFYNVIFNNLEALRNLGEPVDHWNALLIPILIEKLDFNTKREWERRCVRESNRTIKDLFSLIKDRCDILEKLEMSTQGNKGTKLEWVKPKHEIKGLAKSKAFTTIVKNNGCPLCKQPHPLPACNKFKGLSIEERNKEAKRLKVCFNCLKVNHNHLQCLAYPCRLCSKKHHSLLHYDQYHLINKRKPKDESNQANKKPRTDRKPQLPTGNESQPSNQANSKDTIAAPVMKSVANVSTNAQMLLSTAVILVRDADGNFHKLRALIDNCSMSHFITKECCERLKLPMEKFKACVGGIGDASQDSEYRSKVTFFSAHSDYSKSVSCLVLPSVTSNLPLRSFQRRSINLPENLPLADPDFNNSRPVDILLGVEVHWEIQIGEKKPVPGTGLHLQQTELGWILGGPLLPKNKAQPEDLDNICCVSVKQTLAQSLEKFWQIEEVTDQVPPSKEEAFCEAHFKENLSKGSDGKFIVKIPFKENLNELGESRSQAMKQFVNLEKRLLKNEKLYNDYKEFINEYIKLGHMTLIVDSTHNEEELNYYIPHHAVVREQAATTKTRVVFNASMKSDSGLSLNDVQFVGPSIQNDLFGILLNFRIHPYVMTADVSKMYRMIWIAPEDRRFHRIFWRNSPADPIQCFELNTVTYGTASAPYLALRCLKQVAIDNKEKYPEAAKVIEQGFYVDDLLYGASSEELLIQLQREVTTILAEVGFDLRKWLTNKPELYKKFEIKNELQCSILQLGENEPSKTLGVSWNSDKDTILYSTKLPNNSVPTKRTVLSELSQVFDPLGLLGPVIVKGKILIQNLWKSKADWDDEISPTLATEWNEFKADLSNLPNLSIPRQVTASNYEALELHGFGDASEKAYGAAVYLRSIDISQNISVKLLCAKSKVAPVKQQSLPRLELCGALLLSQLMTKVKNLLSVNIDKEVYWSDSTIALAWISAEPCKWKTFVANRVAKVQSLTAKEAWHHINTKDNPADLVSRGASINDLITNKLWWEGPPFLKEKTINELSKEITIDDIPEQKGLTLTAIEKEKENLDGSILKRYSSYMKLVRVTAYLFRFMNNCKRKKGFRDNAFLRVDEIAHAERALVRLSQKQSLCKEYNLLSKGQPVHKQSKLFNLNPIMDKEEKIIRVGGRLENSGSCSFDKKHPMILSSKNNLTLLIGNHLHKELKHCGPTLLLSALRERYWVVRGRQFAKLIIRKCTECFVANPKPVHYPMGNLPEYRVNLYYPFLNVGVDYAGPFLLKDRKTRNPKLIKGYVCLFICMATKAIHLEVVSDLSTAAFISSLRRFINRRGKPANIYSDNGSNFIGAAREIKELYELIKNCQDKIQHYLANERIQWHFIPARSPSFGGLWEAGVKSMKSLLCKTIKNSKLDFEEFNTVLCQIEGILNSRPLCPLSSEPDISDPLTPGHFLIGRSLVSLPDVGDYTDVPENRLDRYQKLQWLVQKFWTRWHSEYLHHLQVRNKRKIGNTQQPTVGTLVILIEDNSPPYQWPMGRITKVHPGSDGVVRVVTVKTKNGEVKRGVNKVCILPLWDDTENVEDTVEERESDED